MNPYVPLIKRAARLNSPRLTLLARFLCWRVLRRGDAYHYNQLEKRFEVTRDLFASQEYATERAIVEFLMGRLYARRHWYDLADERFREAQRQFWESGPYVWWLINELCMAKNSLRAGHYGNGMHAADEVLMFSWKLKLPLHGIHGLALSMWATGQSVASQFP